MDWVATLFLTGLAVVCIYAGYQLFCGLPAFARTGRMGAFFLNIVPGALLALVGMGILTAQVRAVVLHRPGLQRHQPVNGAAWQQEQSGFRMRGA